jgi:hypothetical protein
MIGRRKAGAKKIWETRIWVLLFGPGFGKMPLGRTALRFAELLGDPDMNISEEKKQEALERIRKLIKVSQGEGATEAEVELYMAKARKMMDEMNISEKEAFSQPSGQQEAYDSIKEEVAFSRGGGLEVFFKYLARAVCNVCDTKYYLSERWMKNPSPRKSDSGTHHMRQCIILYGLPRDVAVADELLKELIATVGTMARMRYGKGWNKSHMDYSRGFSTRLIERSEQTKQESSETCGTTAIVLVKDGLLKRWATEKLNLVPGKASRVKISDGGAYLSGKSDANKVSLGTNNIRGNAGSTPKMIGG